MPLGYIDEKKPVSVKKCTCNLNASKFFVRIYIAVSGFIILNKLQKKILSQQYLCRRTVGRHYDLKTQQALPTAISQFIQNTHTCTLIHIHTLNSDDSMKLYNYCKILLILMKNIRSIVLLFLKNFNHLYNLNV